MSKPPYARIRRVNKIIREVVAEEVEELKDPRLGLVSITGVEASPDLRRAVVFISTLDLNQAEETLEALRSAAPRLRRALGAQIRMKYVPALEFELDQGVAQGERIESLLRELHREETDE